MPINPNISLAVRGIELQNPLDQYSKVSAIRNAQQQNQLAQMQMQQSERELASTNAMNRAYSQAYDTKTGDIDFNRLRESLATGGYGSKLPDLEKKYYEGRETKTKALKAETDLLDSKLKQSRQFLETLDPNDPNAADAYMAWHRANHADPVIGKALEARGVTVDQSMQRIQQLMQTPGGLARLINESKLGTEKFMEMNKPVTSVGPTGIVQTPGLGIGDARVVPGTSAAFQMTPAQIAANKIAQGQLAVSQGVPTITQIVDPSNPDRMITIDARRYKGGTLGAPGVLGVGGKEPSAAVRQNKTEAGKTQLADDLDNLRASFMALDEMRAIPSTARDSLSNFGSATAATGIGQTFGRFVGTEAQVEREVINSARTRLVNSIKNATGMSAQQLNSNVELQTMLKSISDPGQPIEAALRIIDDIDNAYVKGSGMPKKNPPSGGGGVDTSNPLLR